MRVIALGIVAVAAALLVLHGLASNPYRSSGQTSLVRDSDVSAEMLDTIAADDEASELTLSSRNVGDDDIQRIAEMGNVTHLTLTSCGGFTSLDSLASKPSLTYLMTNGNQIADISALSEDTKLEMVALGSNQIRDASALQQMGTGSSTDAGMELLLDHNAIESIWWLPSGRRFDALALNGNPVSDVSSLAELEELPILMYLSYDEDADYSSYADHEGGVAQVCLVDVPNERRNQVSDELGISGSGASSFQLRFLSGEEADAELAAAREKLAGGVGALE